MRTYGSIRTLAKAVRMFKDRMRKLYAGQVGGIGTRDNVTKEIELIRMTIEPDQNDEEERGRRASHPQYLELVSIHGSNLKPIKFKLSWAF